MSVSLGPVLNANVGSAGTFAWPGGASAFMFIDPKKQMLLLLMTQYAPADAELSAKCQTLAYQALVD